MEINGLSSTQPCRAGYCLPRGLTDHSPGMSGISIGVDPGHDAPGHPSRMCRCKLDHGQASQLALPASSRTTYPCLTGPKVNVIAQAEAIGRQAGYAGSSRMRCTQYRGCHTPRPCCRRWLSVTGNSVPPPGPGSARWKHAARKASSGGVGLLVQPSAER